MRTIEQYSDQELRDELESRKNLWDMYERRKRDGEIYKVSRLSGHHYEEAMRLLEEENKGIRGESWWHFIVPVAIKPIKKG